MSKTEQEVGTASPLPFKVEDNRDGPLVIDAGGSVVAAVPSEGNVPDGPGPYANRQRDAAYIVHCCNNYPTAQARIAELETSRGNWRAVASEFKDDILSRDAAIARLKADNERMRARKMTKIVKPTVAIERLEAERDELLERVAKAEAGMVADRDEAQREDAADEKRDQLRMGT